MAAHTPDDIETILEDGEENDCSKNDSSAAQEKGSSYVVDRSTNCDNVSGFSEPSSHRVFKRVDDPSTPAKCTIFPV